MKSINSFRHYLVISNKSLGFCQAFFVQHFQNIWTLSLWFQQTISNPNFHGCFCNQNKFYVSCLFICNYLFYKNFVTIQDSYFRKWLLDPMSKDNVWVKIKLSHNYLCQMSQLLFVMPLKRKFEIFFASVMNCKGNFRQATPYQKTELKAQNLLSIQV